MLFVFRFMIALLSSAIYKSAYYRYETKIFPPTRSNLHAIHMTDETALYMYIAASIVSFVLFIVLVLMYYQESKFSKENSLSYVTFILLFIAYYFAWYEKVLFALQMMIVAEILVYFGKNILRKI